MRISRNLIVFTVTEWLSYKRTQHLPRLPACSLSSSHRDVIEFHPLTLEQFDLLDEIQFKTVGAPEQLLRTFKLMGRRENSTLTVLSRA